MSQAPLSPPGDARKKPVVAPPRTFGVFLLFMLGLLLSQIALDVFGRRAGLSGFIAAPLLAVLGLFFPAAYIVPLRLFELGVARGWKLFRMVAVGIALIAAYQWALIGISHIPILPVQIGALVALGLPLAVAISFIVTEKQRARLYESLAPRAGALAPLGYTGVVLWLALVFFAHATSLLAGLDGRVLYLPSEFALSRTLAEQPLRLAYTFKFFVWHLLDAIPLVKANETLHWEEPLRYQGWVGPVVLLFKIAVIGPAIAAFAFFYAKRREPQEGPAPTLQVIVHGPQVGAPAAHLVDTSEGRR